MVAPLPAPCSTRERHRLVAAVASLGLVVVLGLGVASAAGASGAGTAQDPGSTSAPGDPTATSSAPSATAVPTSANVTEATVVPGGTPVPTAPGDTSDVDEENRKIWLVVGGLVAVALGITALTVVYWRHTRPVRVFALPDDEVADAPPAIRGARFGAVEPSAADADPSVVVEPEPVANVQAPASESVGAEGVGTEDGDQLVEAAEGPDLDETAAIEAVVIGTATEASRRSVAGADHADADADWEPHATGEVPAVARGPARIVRPTADQRAAAFAARDRS